MLNQLRQTAPAVALLICVALVAAWVSGAHAHRHVAWLKGDHSLHASAQAKHEHGHSHAQAVATEAAAELMAGSTDTGSHVTPHAASLIHLDGHEDIESHALQPPSGKVLPDLGLLALVSFAVFVLSRASTLVLVVVPDPPASRQAGWTLRPPLRGPPSFSVV
ncbi:MAG: hypothetical protein ACLGIW_00470 [Gammaproteobacteria bacterium]